MSVKKEESGRRSVQVEVEVPGTPEGVWQAIATGPGVSSWFVPTEILEDGTVVSQFGPGMEARATRTAWDPPRRFAAESSNFAPNAPTMATEWQVEAQAGGTCIVRVVHSLFASTDDWDDQLRSVESGWPWFFRVLRLYLTHFRGQQCSAFHVMSFAPAPADQSWAKLTGLLGLSGIASERVRSAEGAPALAGIVEHTGTGSHPHGLMLRTDEPAPGIFSIYAIPMGPQVALLIDYYLYGDMARDAAERNEGLWRAWMNEHFPATGAPEITSCSSASSS